MIDDAVQAETLPANITLAIDCPSSSPSALADRRQMRIVLGNLIRNARDAMPEGGRLSISASADDHHLELAVADTGVGIPPERLPHIAEPFNSTKARGIGLGLALSRAILDKNKGSLHVASEPGRGSTFRIRLLVA